MTRKTNDSSRSAASHIGPGLNMHNDLGVKLHAERGPGITDLGGGDFALSPQRVRDIAEAYNARHGKSDER